MYPFIRVNNKWEPVKVSPQSLETTARPIQQRKSGRPTVNPFRNDPLEPVERLCKVYGISYRYKKLVAGTKVAVELIIEALDIVIKCRSHSVRSAKRQCLFKLHRQYCRQIKYFVGIPEN